MSIRRKISKLMTFSKLRVLWRMNSKRYMPAKIKYLRSQGIQFHGLPKYISDTVNIDGTDYSLIAIGTDSVISSEVRLLTHDYSIMRAAAAVGAPIDGVVRVVKPISIGNNCFIGTRSILMPGTSIGDNVIVGAGSVVNGKVESNAVIAGNPARKVRTIEDHHRIVTTRDADAIRVERDTI